MLCREERDVAEGKDFNWVEFSGVRGAVDDLCKGTRWGRWFGLEMYVRSKANGLFADLYAEKSIAGAR